MDTHSFLRRIAGVWAVLLVAALAVGCGWHLRGSYAFPEELTPIAVEGNGVGQALKDTLRRSDALSEASQTEARSRVEILDERQKRRVISVDANGKVDEYELNYEVRWQLTAEGSGQQSRRILIAPLTFSANRSYDYGAGAVLSKSEEEEVLVETMRDDIAQRILFRLQGWKVGNSDPLGDDETPSGNG